jgi:hypothetical protein
MRKTAATAIAILASVAIASPAFATSTSAIDPVADVLETYFGYTEVGEYEGDLTSATVSYNESVVTVTSTFVELDRLSLNEYFVAIDTNGDALDDYVAGSTKNSPKLGSRDVVVNTATSKVTGAPTVSYAFGTPGKITMTFPATMIGSAPSFQTQILAAFAMSDGSVLNLDAIPQDAWGTLAWTLPVTNTVTRAPAAAPATVTVKKALATKTVAKISSHKQKFHGDKRAKVTITVKASGDPAGKVAIYDRSKKIKTLKLKNSRASYRLPSTLKVGTHKLRVKFIPSNTKQYKKSSSKVLALKVVR